MTSTKLSVRTTDLGVAQAISTALEGTEPALDAVTLFEDGAGAWRIEAYTQCRADAEAAAAALRGNTRRPVADVELEDLPDLNWVAISQAALPPVIAGRFVVHGSHDRGRIPHGPRAILVDAGEAFGTAHHATTLGCLLAIDKLARTGSYRRVLDLGCGSGVLAIAAARAMHEAAGHRHRLRPAGRRGGTRQCRRQRRAAHRDSLRRGPGSSLAPSGGAV